jgi:hypothetical protein
VAEAFGIISERILYCEMLTFPSEGLRVQHAEQCSIWAPNSISSRTEETLDRVSWCQEFLDANYLLESKDRLLSLGTEYLIRHGPHRKHRVRDLFCCSLRIFCLGQMYTEPLPSKCKTVRRPKLAIISFFFICWNKERKLKIQKMSIGYWLESQKERDL